MLTGHSEAIELEIFPFHAFVIIPVGNIEIQPPKNDSKLQTFAAIQDLKFVKCLVSFHLKISEGGNIFLEIFLSESNYTKSPGTLWFNSHLGVGIFFLP